MPRPAGLRALDGRGAATTIKLPLTETHAELQPTDVVTLTRDTTFPHLERYGDRLFSGTVEIIPNGFRVNTRDITMVFAPLTVPAGTVLTDAEYEARFGQPRGKLEIGRAHV